MSDISNFSKDGFILKKNLFSEEEIMKLKNLINSKKEDEARETYSSTGKLNLTLWDHPSDDLFGKFSTNERIVRPMENFLGDEVYHYHSKIIWKKPGDGGTVVIPSSHKSNIQHPEYKKNFMKKNKVTSAETMTASKEIYLKAGDGLIFVDSLCHGSAKRINKGERRIVVYRYGPSWGFFRYPYRPSMNLLKNLNSFQRKIVMPHEKILTP